MEIKKKKVYGLIVKGQFDKQSIFLARFFFFLNLTQATVIWEEGIPTEEMPP